MDIEIKLDSSEPYYKQIISQIKRLMTSGELKPGDQLPPLRNLAKKLDINQNTVARAYKELMNLGLICSHSTNGIFVSDHLLSLKEKLEYIEPGITKLLEDAAMLQLPMHELVDYLYHRSIETGYLSPS